MENLIVEVNANIGHWLSESEGRKWMIVTPDGNELCQYDSESAAHEGLICLAENFGRGAAEKCVVRKRVAWPEYVPAAYAECAESRFCHQALRELGYVTVFAFERDADEGKDASFMVVARNGRRAQGETLTAALATLMRASGIGPWRRLSSRVGSAQVNLCD
ncbi:hypothetical protein [Achromobacter xylosoxidans]|uniref:hypothetical protein n=1 Tax=Alcaligenes xylosoxydans xylosoxydans TaxID=85698 RepID=UPI00104139DA|nr:hypothetical protein [Achromobacter xylosoxidans]